MLGLVFVAAVVGGAPGFSVQDPGTIRAFTPAASEIGVPANPMAAVVSRYSADRGDFDRLYFVRHSTDRYDALHHFLTAWLGRLEEVDFDGLGVEARVDWIVLKAKIDYELLNVDIDLDRLEEAEPLLPFLDMVVEFEADRRHMEAIDPEKMAERLNAELEELKAMDKEQDATEFVALRAGRIGRDLQRALSQWFRFYNGYHPEFSWWVKSPYEEFNKELTSWLKHVNENLGGVKGGDGEAIVGDPIGREALIVDLKNAMIPYSPKELVRLADRELAWCQNEMMKAAAEMGYDNYLEALEHVKTLHVDPGRQPDLIRFLAYEAIDFIEDNDLMTVPELAKVSWDMQMMSPQRQLVNPFFTGGRTISVSFPTGDMTHDQKLMSLRGNNEHFSRATVHHELIPGHHMQGFMNQRYNTHRRAFRTPFWGEGWALYWEILFWEKGFPKTPENKIGMLFWRSHRAARIKFSLGYQLGEMTAQECVDLLVNVVGHELKNAEAEVRRSFAGNYSPLYQCAYLLGGLQFNALQHELVEDGGMSYREYHDRAIRLNNMPIEMVRAIMTGTKLEKDFTTNWRFYGDP